MGFQIEDGRGTGQTVGVSISGNRMDVSSRSDERIYYISRDNGDAYAVVSADAPSAAGEYNFYFKNDSATQKFYVNSITLGAADLAVWKISKVTGTASGTTVTATNLNFTSGNTPSATILGNAAVAGLTESSVIAIRATVADADSIVRFQDTLILGRADAIAVEFDVGTNDSAIHITMVGFFDVE